jgi:hypothetical protein
LSEFYVVYGVRIATNLPLPGFAARIPPENVDLEIRLKREHSLLTRLPDSGGGFFYTSSTCDDDGKPSLKVCTLDGGNYFGFFYCDGARFAVERHGREVWADWPDNYTLEDACTYLIGPVIAFALRLRGVISLHASAIAVGDHAVALFGVAGAGKSTTAAAFALRGFSVLSDDVVALADQGDRFLVQPGYPRVNLWPDSVRLLFGSEHTLPRITPTWDKRYLALDRDNCQFQETPLPLGAIYVLGEREANLTTPVVEELAGHEALATLVTNTYVNYLLDREMRSREFDVLGRVVAAVPVRRVRAAADPSKLSELCEVIASDASSLRIK